MGKKSNPSIGNAEEELAEGFISVRPPTDEESNMDPSELEEEPADDDGEDDTEA